MYTCIKYLVAYIFIYTYIFIQIENLFFLFSSMNIYINQFIVDVLIINIHIYIEYISILINPIILLQIWHLKSFRKYPTHIFS